MADIILNDVEISNLIQERKEFPPNYEILFQTKDKRGHKEQEIILPRSDGSQFKVILRQNQINLLDFSLILGYMPPKKTALIRLRRYNGKSHQHTNKIEKGSFYDFHVHQATERYQTVGFDEDGYAVISKEFVDIQSALDCLVKDCSIALPANRQLKIKGF
ncbi:MAG: hypothetical protein A3J73_05750 [Planctomycetes bacterium RIFCSPHIGHO2_02_FULL_38_41]|nr:MAG: hypothetical protein A3J73_05750 [Planctomycetes bacterium RIFCSPHIGHO2_02_FULL_38_41]